MNDLIEVTLLHARAVLDFFEYSRSHTKVRKKKAIPDDIVGDDYEWPAREVKIDRKVKTRIDKEIAHLSYFRCGLTQEEKMWRFDTFVPVLLRQCLEFLVHVEKRYAAELLAPELRLVRKSTQLLQKYKTA